MEEKTERRLGEEVTTYACPKCEKVLVSLDDAIKMQKRFIREIEEERKVVKIGNSLGITFPQELKDIFPKGEKVRLRFDPETMELSIKAE